MNEDRTKLRNYRWVDTCANCGFCLDIGVDEEVLACHVLGSLYKDETLVGHDGICDDHIRQIVNSCDIHHIGICLDTEDGKGNIILR